MAMRRLVKGVPNAKLCSEKKRKRMKGGDGHLRLDEAVDNQLALID